MKLPIMLRSTHDKAMVVATRNRANAVLMSLQRHREELGRITEPLAKLVKDLVGIDIKRDHVGYRITANLSAQMMLMASHRASDQELDWMADEIGNQVAHKLKQLGISGVVRAAEDAERMRGPSFADWSRKTGGGGG